LAALIRTNAAAPSCLGIRADDALAGEPAKQSRFQKGVPWRTAMPSTRRWASPPL